MPATRSVEVDLGERSTYTRWCPGEPNGGTWENYAVLYTAARGWASGQMWMTVLRVGNTG